MGIIFKRSAMSKCLWKTLFQPRVWLWGGLRTMMVSVGQSKVHRCQVTLPLLFLSLAFVYILPPFRFAFWSWSFLSSPLLPLFPVSALEGAGPSVSHPALRSAVSERGSGWIMLLSPVTHFVLHNRLSPLGLQEMRSDRKDMWGQCDLLCLIFWLYEASKNLGNHCQKAKKLWLIQKVLLWKSRRETGLESYRFHSYPLILSKVLHYAEFQFPPLLRLHTAHMKYKMRNCLVNAEASDRCMTLSFLPLSFLRAYLLVGTAWSLSPFFHISSPEDPPI